MNWNPECYRCINAGWVINSLGTYIYCPVCHDSRFVRILKDNLFKLLLSLFKLSSDSLNKINWASKDTLKFERLYNVELEGKIEQRQELPFNSYEQVFKEGNVVLKNKYAYKIISSYIMGYTESTQSVGTALEILTGSRDLFSLAEKTHHNAVMGKDTTNEFWKAVDEVIKN